MLKAIGMRAASSAGWQVEPSVTGTQMLKVLMDTGESPFDGEIVEFACVEESEIQSQPSMISRTVSGETVRLFLTEAVALELFGPLHESDEWKHWLRRIKHLIREDQP
jgi:hypothetical protein